jgi:hypothetical protein
MGMNFAIKEKNTKVNSLSSLNLSLQLKKKAQKRKSQ